MRKLVVNISLITAITLTILLLYDRFSMKYDRSISTELHAFKILRRAKIIALGNSEGVRLGWGYNPDDIIANFSLNSTRLYETLKVLQYLAPQIQPHQTVVINFSTLDLYDVADDGNSGNHLAAFYYAMPWRMVNIKDVGIMAKSKLQAVNSISGLNGNIIALARHCLPQSVNNRLAAKDNNTEDFIDRPREGRYFYNGVETHLRLMSSAIKNDPPYKANLHHLLAEIHDIGIKGHFRIIFYTAPHHAAYDEHLGTALADSIRQQVPQIMHREGFTYYDFSNNPVFYTNRNYFYDANHLTHTGAAMFTEELLRKTRNN